MKRRRRRWPRGRSGTRTRWLVADRRRPRVEPRRGVSPGRRVIAERYGWSYAGDHSNRWRFSLSHFCRAGCTCGHSNVRPALGGSGSGTACFGSSDSPHSSMHCSLRSATGCGSTSFAPGGSAREMCPLGFGWSPCCMWRSLLFSVPPLGRGLDVGRPGRAPSLARTQRRARGTTSSRRDSRAGSGYGSRVARGSAELSSGGPTGCIPTPPDTPKIRTSSLEKRSSSILRPVRSSSTRRVILCLEVRLSLFVGTRLSTSISLRREVKAWAGTARAHPSSRPRSAAGIRRETD